MNHNHHHHHTTSDNIKIAFFLNLAFTLIEIVGGLLTNSVAILSDAVHDLGDSISLGISWFLERYSDKPEDQFYSYGYRRYSLLGALITTVVLIVGSIFVLSEAIPRLFNPQETDARGMLVISLLGILVNGAAVIRLRGSRSFNAQAVAWHLLEDVLGWIAVFIVSVILLFTDAFILDPILSILITFYILFNVIRNLRKTSALFLQAVPESISIESIQQRIQAIDHVESTHHIHVWSMDGFHHVLTSHVVVSETTTNEEVRCIKEEIRLLSAELDMTHTTIEIEFGAEHCSLAPETSGSS